MSASTIISCAQRSQAGYAHPSYAESLAEFGTPRQLVHSDAWIIERAIPGSGYKDAMGCYPIFTCPDWSALRSDIEAIGTDDIVALSVVTDPFGNYSVSELTRSFNAVVRPFKEHFIIDLSQPIENRVSSHHRRYARKGLRELRIEQASDPARFCGEWVDLYACLVARHQIRGIPVFSRSGFLKQLKVPGIVAFRAIHESDTIGMLLWYVRGKVGYYHLGAYSSVGYSMRASFPLFWSAIEYFMAAGLRWLSLGAGAGVGSDARDGLSSFKQGWSTGTRTAYLCGHIFDKNKYNEIVECKGIADTDYFPAYRKGEFA